MKRAKTSQVRNQSCLGHPQETSSDSPLQRIRRLLKVGIYVGLIAGVMVPTSSTAASKVPSRNKSNTTSVVANRAVVEKPTQAMTSVKNGPWIRKTFRDHEGGISRVLAEIAPLEVSTDLETFAPIWAQDSRLIVRINNDASGITETVLPEVADETGIEHITFPDQTVVHDYAPSWLTGTLKRCFRNKKFKILLCF